MRYLRLMGLFSPRLELLSVLILLNLWSRWKMIWTLVSLHFAENLNFLIMVLSSILKAFHERSICLPNDSSWQLYLQFGWRLAVHNLQDLGFLLHYLLSQRSQQTFHHQSLQRRLQHHCPQTANPTHGSIKCCGLFNHKCFHSIQILRETRMPLALVSTSDLMILAKTCSSAEIGSGCLRLESGRSTNFNRRRKSPSPLYHQVRQSRHIGDTGPPQYNRIWISTCSLYSATTQFVVYHYMILLVWAPTEYQW